MFISSTSSSESESSRGLSNWSRSITWPSTSSWAFVDCNSGNSSSRFRILGSSGSYRILSGRIWKGKRQN